MLEPLKSRPVYHDMSLLIGTTQSSAELCRNSWKHWQTWKRTIMVGGIQQSSHFWAHQINQSNRVVIRSSGTNRSTILPRFVSYKITKYKSINSENWTFIPNFHFENQPTSPIALACHFPLQLVGESHKRDPIDRSLRGIERFQAATSSEQQEIKEVNEIFPLLIATYYAAQSENEKRKSRKGQQPPPSQCWHNKQG